MVGPSAEAAAAEQEIYSTAKEDRLGPLLVTSYYLVT